MISLENKVREDEKNVCRKFEKRLNVNVCRKLEVKNCC